jgi:hypothetical protein
MQLAPELKSKIIKMAMGNTIRVWRLTGVIGMLLKQVFKGDSETAFCHFLYDVSAGNLFCYKDIRHLSRSVWMVSQPSHAMSMGLAYLDDMFRALDDLEFCLRDCGGMLHVVRETPGWNVRCSVDRWRSCKVVIYAASRGVAHSPTDVFDGILYSFDFCNDILHPVGVDREKLLRIESCKTQPFLCFHRMHHLVSNRERGVFACVCKVNNSRADCLIGPNSFHYEYNEKSYGCFLYPYSATRRHLDDVWPPHP